MDAKLARTQGARQFRATGLRLVALGPRAWGTDPQNRLGGEPFQNRVIVPTRRLIDDREVERLRLRSRARDGTGTPTGLDLFANRLGQRLRRNHQQHPGPGETALTRRRVVPGRGATAGERGGKGESEGGPLIRPAGGLDRSPLAVAYGIQMVPHLFVVNKEGKVVNRNAQNGPSLRDELEKLAK